MAVPDPIQASPDGAISLDKGGGETMFQSQGELESLYAVAQRRLGVFEKWFLPIFSAIIGIYQLAIGVYLLRFLRRQYGMLERWFLDNVSEYSTTTPQFLNFATAK